MRLPRLPSRQSVRTALWNVCCNRLGNDLRNSFRESEMIREAVSVRQAELEDFIEAYESVRARAEQVDLAAFLPARDHPLFLPVLCELVRLDLEYAWRHGEPRRLVEY